MDDQDLLGLYPEKPGEHLHRAAAAIHEALRHQEPGTRIGTRGLDASDQRLVLRLLAQRDVVCLRKALHQPEAGVVARTLVLLARVAEPDNQADGHELLLL